MVLTRGVQILNHKELSKGLANPSELHPYRADHCTGIQLFANNPDQESASMDRRHALFGCLAFMMITSILAIACQRQIADGTVADVAAEDVALGPAKPSLGTRIVTIPVWETKTKTISHKVTRPVWEQRSRTITYQVMKPVNEQCTRVDPETGKANQYMVTRFVPQHKEKVINYKVCKMVPEQKQKTVTYKVCRMEKVERPIGSE